LFDFLIKYNETKIIIVSEFRIRLLDTYNKKFLFKSTSHFHIYEISSVVLISRIKLVTIGSEGIEVWKLPLGYSFQKFVLGCCMQDTKISKTEIACYNNNLHFKFLILLLENQLKLLENQVIVK